MDYRDKRELRRLYSSIKDIMELDMIPLQKRIKGVEHLKREIRKIIARSNDKYPEEVRHYSSDGESYYYKVWFDYPFTEEDKQEYIEDNWQHINLPWSSTGQWFTRNIVVCNVNGSKNGRAVVYHFMGLDV